MSQGNEGVRDSRFLESGALRTRVEQFLYLEARLMDEHRYVQWLALFAADTLYWIPSNREDIDPAREVSLLYATRPQLETYVRRLEDGNAFAQSPRSQMRRLVSNVEIESTDAELRVWANFSIVEMRKNVQRLHAGRSEYVLLQHGEDFKIKFKKVVLVGLDAPQENITFLL